MTLGAVALWLSGCGADRPAAPSVAAQVRPAVAGTRFSAGQVHDYDVRWTVRGVGNMPELGDAPVSGGLSLRGTLQLRVYTDDPKGALVGLRLVELDEASLDVMGANVLAEGGARLLERESFLHVSKRGEARRLWVPPDAPSIYRHVMTGLLANVDFVAARPAEDEAWTSVTRNAHGLAEVDYARNGDLLSRLTRGYRRIDAIAGQGADAPWSVEGKTEITLDDQGVPARIEGFEMVELLGTESPTFATRVDFELARTDVTAVDPATLTLPDLATWSEVDTHDPPDQAEAERQLARKFAEGMTATELATMVLSAGYGVRPAAGELIRARGLLRGWPETTEELRPAYADAPDLRTRKFVVDLLVSADTPESQRLLLDLLPGPDDPELVTLAQHLSLLRTPLPEVGERLLLDQFEAEAAGDAETRRGLLYPIGSLAARFTTRDPALSERLVNVTRDALASATDPDDIVAALAGLGNAARAEDIATSRALAEHPDQDVRAQVAGNLRWAKDTASVDVLFAMLDDSERYVAATALSVIDAKHAAKPEHLHRLARATIEGTHHAKLNGPLISVLAHHGPEDELVREALLALWERSTDPHERGRLYRMLGLASG